jgi:hypothetical protein
VINLVTTDDSITPYVNGVCVMMDAELDYMKSIVGDSVVPALRNSIQPTFDFALDAPGGTTIVLDDLETPYSIIDVTAVYNHTQDPDHLTDLLSSYNVGTKTITLTTAIPIGEVAWIRMQVQPKVYVNWASQDYVQVEQIPAIVINTIIGSGNITAGRAYVKNAFAKTAQLQEAPFRLSLEFEVLLLAKDNGTLLVMQDHGLEFTINNQLLHWPAVDSYISLTPLIGQDFSPRPNLSDKHQSSFVFRLDDIYLWLKQTETVSLVENVNVTLTHTSKGLRFGQLQQGIRTEP